MKHRAFARLSRSGRRLIWSGALLALLAAAGTTAIGDVTEEAKRAQRDRDDSFGLFAGPTAVLSGNQLQCGLVSGGEVCKDVFDSPTGNGGFWPTGSPNGYIYNTGLQIAGIIGEDGGPWANDTVGGYFFDARGSQRSGTALTDIYVSSNDDDAANWPTQGVFGTEGAYVTDTELFDESLVSRDDNRFVSQEDSWFQYWEGDPVRITNRQHPMGIMATQRSLAWNYPSGNESVLYFIYTFKNVTNVPEFQSLNESAFFGGDNALPDAGYTINELFAAFGTDMDVTLNAGENFSTAILPFDIGLSYHGGFNAPDFVFTPDLFFPPFFTNSPGIVGVKYLKSPINPDTGEPVGLTLFSNHQNPSSPGAVFLDALGDKQLWRYISGRLDPSQGDPPCNVDATIITGDPRTTVRPLCYIAQQALDTRFFQSSGPFSLPAGGEGTIVVAYIVAPTVNVPEITPNSAPNTNPPGVPSFHPDFPSQRACDANGANCTVNDPVNAVLPIEKGAGWIDYIDMGAENPGAPELSENKVDQRNIQVVPGSLLGRALVAQTVFESKFLLGSAPEPPTFYLVPGDGSVTVIWQPTISEETGDPFYTAASDPESPLYNPNYRLYDVEGYRIWRGPDPGKLELMAQFDYDEFDTQGHPATFIDNTCETVDPTEDIGNPAGVGYAAGETCPYATTPHEAQINSDLVFNNGSEGGPPGGGVVRSASGAAVGVNVIHAIVDDASGPSLRLNDLGVPFAWEDRTPVNNFTYFYSVSAFDVNSQASGPHSLRSLRPALSTVPRVDAPNLVGAELISALYGDDGVALNPNALMPNIDPADGTWSGPMPPTDGFEQTFAPLVPRLLPQLDFQAKIDSVKPDWVEQEGCGSFGWAFQSVCYRAYLTINGAPVEIAGLASNWNSFGRPSSTRTLVVQESVPFDADALTAFNLPEDAAGAIEGYLNLDESINFSNWEGQQNRRGAHTAAPVLHGGPRWFSGTEESTPDPTKYTRVGHLAEVDSVWIPIHHTQISADRTGTYANSGTVQYFGYFLAHLGRAADFRVTWSGGTVTVRDITHNVDVPFSTEYGSSWGFLNNDADGSGAVDWKDFFCVGADAKAVWEDPDNLDETICPAPTALSQTPEIGAIALDTNDPQGQTHTGFAMYLNAMRHFFVTDALPADGTVWTFRSYVGVIECGSGCTGDNPGGYTYSAVYDDDTPSDALGLRSPLIPGLTAAWTVEAATGATGPTDLTKVHTVPDPYLSTSQYDLSPTSKTITFVNLPPKATIRIYSLSGVLVDIVEHDDVTGGGREPWDVRNRNNQFVASGVYFFHVVEPGGQEYVGKFTVVNFAGQN